MHEGLVLHIRGECGWCGKVAEWAWDPEHPDNTQTLESILPGWTLREKNGLTTDCCPQCSQAQAPTENTRDQGLQTSATPAAPPPANA